VFTPLIVGHSGNQGLQYLERLTGGLPSNCELLATHCSLSSARGLEARGSLQYLKQWRPGTDLLGGSTSTTKAGRGSW